MKVPIPSILNQTQCLKEVPVTTQSGKQQNKQRPVEPMDFRHWPSAVGEELEADIALLDESLEDEDIEKMLAATAAKATTV